MQGRNFPGQDPSPESPAGSSLAWELGPPVGEPPSRMTMPIPAESRGGQPWALAQPGHREEWCTEAAEAWSDRMLSAHPEPAPVAIPSLKAICPRDAWSVAAGSLEPSSPQVKPLWETTGPGKKAGGPSLGSPWPLLGNPVLKCLEPVLVLEVCTCLATSRGCPEPAHDVLVCPQTSETGHPQDRTEV